MFIINSNEVQEGEGVEKVILSKWIGNYFIKQGIPLFGIEEDKHVFIKTKNFVDKYNEAPLYIKVVCKI